MSSATSDRIAKLEPRQKPQAQQIIQEVRDAVSTAQGLGVFDKINRAHLTRRCLWDNQSDDGMKHGDTAFPWDRAIDSRVPLADEIVSDHVRVRMAACRQGAVRIGPQNEIEDSGKARLWDDVLKYYRNQIKRPLQNALKLFCTCVEEIGYGVMQLDWRDVRVMRPVTITENSVASFLAQRLLAESAPVAEGMAEMEAQMQEQAAQTAMAQLSDLLADPERKLELAEILTQMDPGIATSEGAKAHAALAKDGTATVYSARGQGGLPVVKARIPWVDCGHAVDLGPEGKCSFWFVVEWLDEVAFRMLCEQEKCPDAWRDAVLQQPNRGLSELMTSTITVPDWLLNGVGIGLSFDRQQPERAPMFQILRVTRVAVNEAGVPACYETLVHPHVPDQLGKHECCAVPELPFIAEAREAAGLMMQSRGVPEIILTEQLGLKKLKDATVAMGELAAFPPYERALGDTARIAPGTELPLKRSSGTSGTQSRFLDVPGVDEGALKAMEMVRSDVDRLFVRGPQADPDSRRLFLEELGQGAVLSYEEIMRLMWLHVQTYVDELHASRIAGRPVSVQATAADLEGTADVTVEFSAMALNQKTALELADYVTKLAGLDKSGRIDFGRAVELITRIFDPLLSENIITPSAEAASGEIEKDEQGVINSIAAGQYVTGHVNAPQLRWQVLQRWFGNPATVPMLQEKPFNYASLLEHIKGLQQELVQKTTNVFTGQTGQKPEAPWETGTNLEAQVRGMVEGPLTRMAA